MTSSDGTTVPEDETQGDETGLPDNTAGVDEHEQPAQGPASLDNGSWTAAKKSLGRAVRSGGQREAYRVAGRNYVRAHGGAARAAKTAEPGRTATARFGQFFADVAARGIDAALISFGLSGVVGQGAETVLAAIANVLSPDGATREGAVARDSVTETLEFLYEQFSLQDGDLSRLDAMGAGDIKLALGELIGNYVFNRWLEELGRMIEDRAVSAAQAIMLERDVREHVRESIRLDLENVDVLAMDWAGVAGQSFVDAAFTEAYSLLEGGR
ncbi:Qat anti-phage system associated protein QatB [Corallococcus carmarthensis]|uniref:Qat anti-phage system associated protein QatB n=1 Tax=Corallococcus carmarthensis TaxID=2316728 RepID=UPI00148E6B33|nr:Qat anti-phage system associated protein QatB [Corallococcus carmarthensis]NOK20040.1 hypothetical protein [Corallococcus carmarthensis]